jgi:hypothetical protein
MGEKQVADVKITKDKESIEAAAGPIGGYVRFLGPNQTTKPQTWKWKVLFSGKKSGGPNSYAYAKVVMGTPSTSQDIQLYAQEDRHFDSYNLAGDGEVYLNPGMEMMILYTFGNQSAVTEEIVFEVVRSA